MTIGSNPTPGAKHQQSSTLAASPYAQQPITKTPNWGWKTALDVSLNNLSVGLFLVAAVAALLAPARFLGLTMIAYPLALLLLVADLLSLVLDLGDPMRFHHMLRVFKLSSPMSLGTWSLSGYGILLGIATVAAVLRWPLFAGIQTVGWLWTTIDWIGRIVAALALIPAVGAILYKGVLFSVSSQPGWQDARWLGAYICNSAIVLGSSVLLMIAAVSNASGAAASLRPALLALLLLDVIFFFLVYRALAPVFKTRYGPNQKLFFWLTLVAAGWLLPFLLLLPGAYLELLPPLLILAAAIAVRFAFVLLPQVRRLTISTTKPKEMRL